MKLQNCTEWLLFHLWQKNPETDKSCPGVLIPNTIIYRWAQPYFWYYNSKDGQIIRKTKEKMNVNQIFSTFHIAALEQKQSQNFKNQQSDNVAATYMKACSIQNQEGLNEKIEFEYITEKNLQSFVFQRDKQINSILQSFVMPYNDKNQLIKVLWTPQFCLYQRKTNIYNILKQNVPIENRLVTFEGSEHLSIQDSVQSLTMQNDIDHLCSNIIRHIQEVSAGNIQISRLVLYFKVNQKNRLYLLFCTDLRIRDKFLNQDNEPFNKIQPPLSPILQISIQKNTKPINYINMSTLNIKGQVDLYNGKNCLYCKKIADLYDLPFNYVIMSYEQNLMTNEDFQEVNPEKPDETENRPNYATTLEQQGIDFKVPFLNEESQTESKNKKVPLFLEYVWGKLSQQVYDKLKQNITWTSLNTKVCDECYMKFTVVSSVPETEIQYQQNHGQQYSNIQSKINKQNITFYSNQISSNIQNEFSKEINAQNLMNIQNEQQSIFKSEDFTINSANRMSYRLIQSNNKILDQFQIDNITENQQNYYNFKQKQKITNNDFYQSKSKKKQILNNQSNEKLLIHLKKMNHDHELAKTQITLDFTINNDCSLEKTYRNKIQTNIGIKNYKTKTIKFPKVFKQKEINSTIKTETTNNDTVLQLDHNQMMTTLRNLKQKLQDF